MNAKTVLSGTIWLVSVGKKKEKKKDVLFGSSFKLSCIFAIIVSVLQQNVHNLSVSRKNPEFAINPCKVFAFFIIITHFAFAFFSASFSPSKATNWALLFFLCCLFFVLLLVTLSLGDRLGDSISAADDIEEKEAGEAGYSGRFDEFWRASDSKRGEKRRGRR